MKTEYIRKQLDTVLAATVDPKTVAWENVPFTPTAGETWYRQTLLPANTVNGTFCGAEYKGIYQIDLFAVGGGDSYSATRLAAAIANAFNVGKIGDIMLPEPPSIGAGRNDDGWYHIPIRVNYEL